MKEGLKNSQIQDFLYSVDRFVDILSSSRQNLEDRIQLAEVDIDTYVSNLQSPSDYITASKEFLQQSKHKSDAIHKKINVMSLVNIYFEESIHLP